MSLAQIILPTVGFIIWASVCLAIVGELVSYLNEINEKMEIKYLSDKDINKMKASLYRITLNLIFFIISFSAMGVIFFVVGWVVFTIVGKLGGWGL